ncbi:hypothetical protein GOODEAATRI_017728, partial [Goodea atripinnis]
VEAETVNASAIRVKWRAPAPELQHGHIRGYQVHYVRTIYGEPQGQPLIKDILIDDSQWYPPPNLPTPLLGYRLTFGRVDILPFTIVEFPSKETRYTALDISKGANYVFRLSARNKMGYGEETVKEVTTPEDAPTGYPENIILEEASATSLKLTWKSVPLIEQNGRIAKYSVLYKDINSRGNATEMVVPAPGSSVLLERLSADTVYDVRVCAFTAVGPGPYSPSVQFRTQQLDQALDPTAYSISKILYGKGQSVEVDGKQTQKLITGLDPDTQYSFLLTNRANSAGGLQHRVTATTAPDILKSKPLIVGKTNADGMVTVQLPTVQTTAKVREINRTSVSRALRIRRQASQSEPRAYITAHFKTLPLEFTLGDSRNYGDFRNRPLQGGQEYVFFVLALLDLSENVRKEPRLREGRAVFPAAKPCPPTIPQILWSCGGSTSKPQVGGKQIQCCLSCISVPRLSAFVKLVSLSLLFLLTVHPIQDEAALIGNISPSNSCMASHPPVPISELADHIERLKANDNLKFSQEYEVGLLIISNLGNSSGFTAVTNVYQWHVIFQLQ